MDASMNARHELWKYMEISSHSIHEWNNTLFKKVLGIFQMPLIDDHYCFDIV